METVLQSRQTCWWCSSDPFLHRRALSIFLYNFIYLFVFGCAGSLLPCGLFSSAQGLVSSCSARTTHCGCFSRGRTRALECRLSSCGARAQFPHGTWNPPRQGIEPMSPALASGFLTTGLPGKSMSWSFELRMPFDCVYARGEAVNWPWEVPVIDGFAVQQRSPTFLALGTSFMEDSFPQTGLGGWFWGWCKCTTFIMYFIHIIIITLAPPQIIRYWIPEVGDPWCMGLQI